MAKATRIIDETRQNLKAVENSGSVDNKCPFTGGLKVRDKLFTGIVVSKDTHRTVQVEWSRRKFVKKFERFMVGKTKVSAHNPDVIAAQIGDKVVIAECRPISKTKKFVIIQNQGHSKEYMVKRSVIEEDLKIAKAVKSTPDQDEDNIQE
jgi:small subunit ribosomal protein S17